VSVPLLPICPYPILLLPSPSSVFLKLFVRHGGDAFPAFLFVLCAIFCVAPLCWYFYVFWQIALARMEDGGWRLNLLLLLLPPLMMMSSF